MPPKVLSSRFLTAGNRVHLGSAMLAHLAIGEDRPDPERLAAIALVLHEFDPPTEVPASPRSVASVVADLSMALLWRGREPDRFCRVLSGPSDDPAEIAIACRSPVVARMALGTACRLLARAPGRSPSEEIGRFIERAASLALFEEDVFLAETAERRGIHWRLSASGKREVLLGEGRGIRRSIANQSDRTSFMAGQLVHSKALTNRALLRAGFPATRQQRARSVADAITVAKALGYPVVVKPVAASRGTGVACNLINAEEVADAFQAARAYGAVIVENFLEGDDHRLLVIDGRLVSCGRRRGARVTGDGTRTVDELIARANALPERQPAPDSPMMAIVQDEESDRVLRLQSLSRQSVPERGQVVRLRATANWSQGGTGESLMDRVHPENAQTAVAISRHFGMDIVGIDVITTDIGVPLRDSGGAINEVQGQPAIGAQRRAIGRIAAELHEKLLDYLVPSATPHRIPIIAVVGPGAGAMAERIADGLAETGRSVGLGSAAGMRVEGRWLSRERHDGAHGLGRLVDDPTLDAVVIEVDPAELIARGLGHRRIDAALTLAPQEPAVAALLARLADGGVACLGDHETMAAAAAVGKRAVAIATDRADGPAACAAAAIDLCGAGGALRT